MFTSIQQSIAIHRNNKKAS